MRAKTDGHGREVPEDALQEQELHFERMLARMRTRVLDEQLRLRHQRVRERRVDRDGAQRRVVGYAAIGIS